MMNFIISLNKINFFSIFVLTTILLSGSILASPMAFADDEEDDDDGDDKKKNKKTKTLESECAKKLEKKKLNLDGLFCQAILGFQLTADSFFDIFVELEDTANFDCPAGEYAVGTGIDGELICAPTPESLLFDQRCTSPEVMVGIDANGIIICDLIQDTLPPVPVLELCNGFDDDSNPATLDGADEPWVGQSCDGPDADSCSEGFYQCSAGAQVCTDTTGDSIEILGNNIDDDCDGQTDEGEFVDLDGDGYPVDVDCDDGDPSVHPDQISYFDADRDGYGDAANITISCGAPTGYVLDGSDCDDDNVNAYPGNAEVADGVDNDCNGQIDEGLGPLLIINEILFDGSVNGDPNCDGVNDFTDDEFVEIVNVGSSPVDLTGITLHDADLITPRHTFTSGTILDSGSAIVVYGGGTPSCSFPVNVLVDVASSASDPGINFGLALTDSGDTITLRDSSGAIIDEHTWSFGVADESIVRSPEFVSGAPFVPHTSVGGLDYSPGTDVFGNIISP